MTASVVCAGCGAAVPAGDPLPFACPGATGDDDVDHVLTFSFDANGELPSGGSDNPFIRYRHLLWIWHAARDRGLSDDDYVALVTELDARVAGVDGRGFGITPYARLSRLGAHVKNETGNVSGSHKARHLMGIAIHLAIIERCGAAPWTAETAPSLAIASCGNAALAAAVVARAGGRPLQVFIPTWADAGVVRKLSELGAELIVCERSAGAPPGDPCYRRFRAAVAAGALPFSCQGPDNGLAIDGGRTLGLELVAQHRAAGDPPLTHLFVQVGGGALASATWQALETAVASGALEQLPAVVAVQTEGAHPLERAWRRLANGGAVAVDRARTQRSQFMWPWETEPKSIASGILDDETYDWWQVVRGLDATGGDAVLASEVEIERATRLARDAGISASPTGAAGYAGLLAMRARGEFGRAEPAVLFTGARR